MRIPSHAIILGLLGLSGVSSGLPITNASTPAVPGLANATTTVSFTSPVNFTSPINTTSPINLIIPVNATDPIFDYGTDGFLWLRDPADEIQFRSLAKRADLPPRDRTLADHMENYGQDLPECYKKCMRSEDGKAQMHMGKDTLGTICGIKWPLFAWWSEHHIYFCVNGKNGCQDKESHRKAYRWLKWTCGDKPN